MITRGFPTFLEIYSTFLPARVSFHVSHYFLVAQDHVKWWQLVLPAYYNNMCKYANMTSTGFCLR